MRQRERSRQSLQEQGLTSGIVLSGIIGGNRDNREVIASSVDKAPAPVIIQVRPGCKKCRPKEQ